MGTKEYHAQKSKEWYHRQKENHPEKLQERTLYSTKRRNLNKKKWVSLFGGKCQECGGIFPDCVFEFHHTNHLEKEYNPSHLFHLREETIKQELSKCIMLCANCHRIVHDDLKYDAHSKRTL